MARRAVGAAAVWLAAALWPLARPACAAQSAAATHLVAYRDVSEAISAEGVVEAVRQSTLAAQVAGQIVELRVKVGDRVKAGQMLVRIDARAAQQALAGSQSQLAEAQAGLGNAARNYARSKSLFAQQFLSKAALDQSERDFTAAQARVATLQAGAGQAATAHSLTTIAAPYAGVVAAIPVELGDMAVPGRALISMFDPAAMRVLATLPQSRLGQIKPGMPVRVEAAEASLNAQTVTLEPLTDSRTHTARLRIGLGADARLSPGQFARAWFATGTARRLAIPARCVLRRSELTAVYVHAGGQMQLRQVRLGEASPDGYVEVLSGLREGERIALDPVRAGLAGAAPQG